MLHNPWKLLFSFGPRVSLWQSEEQIEASRKGYLTSTDIMEMLKSHPVEWTDAGVTFNEPSGNVLFIPKRMFIGGR